MSVSIGDMSHIAALTDPSPSTIRIVRVWSPTYQQAAWFETYLGGHSYTFDAHHNKPRTGRILMARERDATDVAIRDLVRPVHARGLQGGDATNQVAMIGQVSAA